MPIRITNSQSKISGEILGFDYVNTGSQTLTTGYTLVDVLSTSFDSDRNGQVLIIWKGYITNSCSSNTKVDISMRLVNQSNFPVSNTTIDVHTFLKPGSTVSNGMGCLVTAQWVVNVNDGSNYTYKPQIKKTSTTNAINIDFTQPSTFEVIGL